MIYSGMEPVQNGGAPKNRKIRNGTAVKLFMKHHKTKRNTKQGVWGPVGTTILYTFWERVNV